MPLWLAVVLLLLSLLGIVLSRRYLQKPVQSVCVVLCVLLAAACAAYSGFLFFFGTLILLFFGIMTFTGQVAFS